MSVRCPNCDAVASYGRELGHKIDCPSLSLKVRRPAQADSVSAEAATYDRSGVVPVAWIAFAANGNIRLWTADEGRAKDEKARGLDMRAFTLAELVALVAGARTPAASIDLDLDAAMLRADTAESEVKRLSALIGRPYIGAWTDEILIEAAHQRDRWGNEHDHGKTPEDWFWLIGYLAGKCLAAHKAGDLKKAHHHTVSTGAVLAHWASAVDGHEGVFRPGVGAEKVAGLTASAEPFITQDGTSIERKAPGS